MDPAWEVSYGPRGSAPPQFYPGTWYYFVENAPRPVVELWTQEYVFCTIDFFFGVFIFYRRYINSLADYIIRRAGEIPNNGSILQLLYFTVAFTF